MTDFCATLSCRLRRKMVFLPSFLLLSSSLFTYAIEGKITQTPNSLSVKEGDSVQIQCCWSNGGRFHQPVWWKDSVKYNDSVQVKECNCTGLIFKSIKHEDAGRYICEVTFEIPVFTTVKGTGTNITVRDKDEARPSTEEPATTSAVADPVTAVLSVLGGLILILCICCCYIRRKIAMTAMVIYEAPQTDSELAESEKHSTGSSTGSTQWCPVEVYESVEYFERHRT